MRDDTLSAMEPAEEEAAFAAFLDVLRGDDVLGRVVRTWVYWDGDPADALPPTADMTPWVRISPSSGTPDRLHSYATSCPVLVDVECCVGDLSAAARFRFWSLVRRAALPEGSAAKDRVAGLMATAGVRDLLLTRNGYGIDSATEDGLVVSRGQFLLDLQINT